MSKILTFTGHRSDKLSHGKDRDTRFLNFKHEYAIYYVDVILIPVIAKLYLEGYNHLKVGMALGFDTVAAMAGLWVKKHRYSDLFIEACVPCRKQDKLWSLMDRMRYNKILTKVDKATIVSNEEYTSTRGGYLMQKRNKYMADGATGYISCWDGSKGGTKNFIDYANKIGLTQIINYDPKVIIKDRGY